MPWPRLRGALVPLAPRFPGGTARGVKGARSEGADDDELENGVNKETDLEQLTVEPSPKLRRSSRSSGRVEDRDQ